jgi:EAL and modified HD-GYP domain-containing signal transduction protein
MTEIYVGRQPIYNQLLDIYGYELLFRNSDNNAVSFDEITPDGATSTTIINSFFEFGLDKLVGRQFAFINLTEKFLLENDLLPIGPGQVVLEILEDVPINEELIKSVERLSSQGFTIALDDYVYNPAHKPLVAMADIIKIDIMALSQKDVIEHVNILKEYKAKLLAEKIETRDEYDFCLDLGFDYFQGYFLSRPRIIKGRTLPTNKLAAIKLLAILHNPSAATDELEKQISIDASMSYKLLKCINSAYYCLPRKVDSIKQAIVMLGRRQINSIASLLALSNTEDMPLEIIHLAIVRAKMCEFLANAAGLKPADTYFTAGLLSALDIVMERDLAELIKPLPLSEEVVDALLYRKGVLGEALTCTLAYEVSDFENVKFQDLDSNDINAAKFEAVNWSNMIMETL